MEGREERWIELETRVAFQERALAQLDEVVRDLYAQLGRLQREVEQLRARQSEARPAADPAAGFADGLLDED